MKTLRLSALIIFISLNSFAQEARKKDPCDKASESGVTFDLVECSQKKLAEADAELNKTYKQLASKLGEKQWKMKLRTAQQAWIKYRDANCDYESEFSGGGSAATFEYNFCLADMTTARAKELHEMIDKIREREGN